MISHAATSSLDNIEQPGRVALNDCSLDWVTLSLEKALKYLMEEAPHFKTAIAEMVRREGVYVLE